MLRRTPFAVQLSGLMLSILSIVMPIAARANEPILTIARVIPISGRIDLHLQNNIGTPIIFEAAGYTTPASLNPGQEILLRNLPTPVTVKIYRADGGLLNVHPLQKLQNQRLDLALDEASPLSDDSGIVQIRANGQVQLNQ